jgi:anti-sigma regulatory factor (Ser/Thr protein kinase)
MQRHPRQASGPDADSLLNIKIPADPKFSRLVRERIASYASKQDLSTEAVREFVTAIGEAVANAIEHSRSDTIEITCWVDGNDELVASISDSGLGFSGMAESVPLPPPHAERGRGLPLMRRYTDLFSIETEPGRGTRVLLGRKLHVRKK